MLSLTNILSAQDCDAPVCLNIIVDTEIGICSNPAIPEAYCEMTGNTWFTGSMDIQMINQPGCTYFEGTTKIFSNVMTEAECGALNCTDPQYTTEEECEAATEEWDQYQGIWFDGNVLGFQFIISSENMTIAENSVVGGTAVDLGYTINVNPDYYDDVDGDGDDDYLGTMFQGFTLSMIPIPPGEGALVTVGFTDYTEYAICFKQYCTGAAGENTCTNAIIGNDPNGNCSQNVCVMELDVDWGECSCGDTEVADECGVCDGDGVNSNIYGDCECQIVGNVWADCAGECGGDLEVDCSGECGGSSVVDDCDVCGGGNADLDCAGVCFGESALDDCGVCGGDNTTGCYNNDCDTYCDCDGNVEDCAGVCGGDAIVDEEGECDTPPCDAALGDINGDGTTDVMDIITMVNCIVFGDCLSLEYICAGDLNDDGGVNIMDVVGLVNCILGGYCGE